MTAYTVNHIRLLRCDAQDGRPAVYADMIELTIRGTRHLLTVHEAEDLSYELAVKATEASAPEGT